LADDYQFENNKILLAKVIRLWNSFECNRMY